MANKFLPFIVEKSTPVHIYQTLLTRSKGMNTTLIISIFHLVVHQGIKPVRDYVKGLPDMSLEPLYEELMLHYQEDKIDDNELALFLNLEPYIIAEDSNRWIEELADFTIKDILAFFLVMAKIDSVDDVTEMNFKSIYLSDKRAIALNNIQNHVEFSDIAPKKNFKSPEDLKAYILYQSFLVDGDLAEPICAVFKSDDE